MSLITRESLLDSSDDAWFMQQEHADRIAMELTKADKRLDTVHSMRKRFDLLHSIIRVSQESIAAGDATIPTELAVDQIEDWFIASAVKAACEAEAPTTDPVIRTMESEYALHGFRTPQEAGHRWGD